MNVFSLFKCPTFLYKNHFSPVVVSAAIVAASMKFLVCTLGCLITVQGRLLILGENSPKRRLFLLNKLLNKKRPGDPVLFSTRTLIPTTPVIRQARVGTRKIENVAFIYLFTHIFLAYQYCNICQVSC